MSTIGTNVSLLDLAKRKDPNGSIALIAELLSQRNEILDDMHWQEGNLETGHKSTIRTGLPAATWRKLYQGIQPSKSTTAQVTDTCGMLEAYSEIDKALSDLNGNTPDFRLSEDIAYLESMNQSMAQSLFYGDVTVNPERFTGLAPRFIASSTDPTQSGFNIVKGIGAGNTNTSVWLVVWGPLSAHGIVPKGSKAGFQHQDLGEQTLYDANMGRYQGYRTHYKWDCGLTVRDWRQVSRGANIDVSQLTKAAATGDDLIDVMTQMLEKVWDLKMGRPAFYVNRTVKSFLRRQQANKVATSTLTIETVMGKEVLTFGGVPVRRCDQLLSTEATIA